MKSFLTFFNEQFLALESIMYLDRTFFRRLVNEDKDLMPTAAQIDEANSVLDHLDEKDTARLDDEEELALIRTYKANPNSEEGLEARNKVLTHKLKYIVAIANRLERQGVIKAQDVNDAISYGVQGLTEAIDRFDETKAPAGFTPWALTAITGAIRNPYNPKRSRQVDSGRFGEVTSMDAEISGDRGEWADKDQSVADKVADWTNVPGNDMNNSEENELIREFLHQLPDQEEKAIRLYFGMDDAEPKTYEEIGDILGMTKPGARAVVLRALAKLKEKAKEAGY